MLLKIFSIRDSKGEMYNQPFLKKTMGEAERDFHQLCQDEKSMVWKYPDDFDLYYLGDFDDQSGKLSSLATPQHIVKAVQVLKQ